MKGLKLKYCMLLLVIWLSGCVSGPVKPKIFIISPAPTMDEVKRVQAQRLISQLRLDPNVRYIQKGDQVRIVMCGDAAFYPGSATLVSSPSLETVSNLLQLMQGVSTEVKSYTNWLCTANLNTALANRQARVLASYLWHNDIDTRLLYTRGYGSPYPARKIYSKQNPAGIYPPDCVHRRVEICFQDP